MSNEDMINQVKEQIQKEINMSQVEELIKNNINEFEYKQIKYRVGTPNFIDKQKAYEVKVEKFTELLQDKRYKLQEDLKKLWLDRGINIDELTDKINNLEGQKNNLELKLGELLKNSAPDTDLVPLRDEIKAIKTEQYLLSIKKTDYLQYSIESQVAIAVYRYLTFAVAQKQDGEKWVPAWANYQDFLNEEEALVNTFSFYVSLMIGPM